MQAQLSNDKIHINTRNAMLPSEEFSKLVAFLRSLPSPRFDRSTKSWVCRATSGAAWRIVRYGSFDCDSQVQALAAQLEGKDGKPCGNGSLPAVYRTVPRKHQLAAYEFAKDRNATLLHMAMGTGKTLVAIQLLENWDCKKTLVLCPKSVVAVWSHEIDKHSAINPAVVLLTKGTTRDKVADASRANGDRVILVINYESARMKAFAEWSCEQNWDLVILDESHRAKSPRGVTSRYVHKLASKATRRLCLTGTPMPHSPLDIYGQFAFLDAGLFGTSWTRFRHRYAILGGYEQHEVVGYRNLGEMQDYMGLITYQCGEEALDLPEASDNTRRFELSPQAGRYYRELENDMMTQLEADTITASNGLVKLLRLQQVTSGYLPGEDGKYHCIDNGKAALLLELLEDISLSEKVVVFCRFTHDVDAVLKTATEAGRSSGQIDGRRNQYQEWKQGSINTLAVQMQAGSLGIDLTETRYSVYFSTGFSLGDYNQSRARLYRPGQTRHVYYYHLLASGTIDEAVVKAIRNKEEIVDSVLSNLKGGVFT